MSIFMSIFHQMHFVVQSDCGYHEMKSFSNKLCLLNPIQTQFCQSISAVSLCWYQNKVSRRVLKLHYFPQFYSDAASVPPQFCACTQFVNLRVPLISLCQQLSMWRQVFSWQGPPFIYIPFSSYPSLTPYRCSYRFTRQSLVVLRRRSHRTSRLLTRE